MPNLVLFVVHWQVNIKRDAKYTLKASYLEIYNEGVYDLVHFSPKAKSLPVKWDASYGFYVQGLKVKTASACTAQCQKASHCQFFAGRVWRMCCAAC